jgi:hypothetical protein
MLDDARFAAAARDDGLRRVRRLTFQIAAAALAGSAGIAAAFGHLSGASATSQARGGTGSQNGQAANPQPGNGGTGGLTGPAADPQPGSGGSVQPPAQNLQPAQGPAQGVSGGS